jgi:hypothetical protein
MDNQFSTVPDLVVELERFSGDLFQEYFFTPSLVCIDNTIRSYQRAERRQIFVQE